MSIVREALNKTSRGRAGDAYLDSQCGCGTPLRREVESLLNHDEQTAPMCRGRGGRNGSNTGRLGPGPRCTTQRPPTRISRGPCSGPTALSRSWERAAWVSSTWRRTSAFGAGWPSRPCCRRWPPASPGHETVCPRSQAGREDQAQQHRHHLQRRRGPGRSLPRHGVSQGESLDKMLRREKTLPLPEVVRIGLEIAEGLAAAHEKTMIHRDIKPANVWLEGSGPR